MNINDIQIIKEKKILFVENFKIFENWASKTYPFKCERIKEDTRFEVYDFGSEERLIEPTDYSIILFGWHGIPINKYYTTKQSFYSKYVKDLENERTVEETLYKLLSCKEVKRYVLVQDMHDEDYKDGLKGFIDFLKRYDIDGLITPYYCTDNLSIVRKNVPNLRTLSLMHHIDHTIFKDYKLQKKYDILLFGNDHPKFYPFRHRLIKLLDARGKEVGINVHKVTRPRNYFKYNAAVSNASLSKLMNQSWLTLCTSSNLDYLLGKYFESSFSGSVVCGNMATDGVHIWENDYVYLDQSMDDDLILQVILKALEDKENLKKIAYRMHLKMNNDFRLDHFTNHLYSMLKV